MQQKIQGEIYGIYNIGTYLLGTRISRGACPFVVATEIKEKSRHFQNVRKRIYATEADPEEYVHFPDPLEQYVSSQKKVVIAKLEGDDRYEPRVYYRGPNDTRDYPNLVPCVGDFYVCVSV